MQDSDLLRGDELCSAANQKLRIRLDLRNFIESFQNSLRGFSITFNFGTDNKQCKLKRQLKLVSYLLIVWPRLCSDPDDPLSKNLTDFHKIWLKLSSSTKAYNDVGDDGDGPSQMINVGDKFEVFVTACIFLVAI